MSEHENGSATSTENDEDTSAKELVTTRGAF
jgi:hypothetical protein